MVHYHGISGRSAKAVAIPIPPPKSKLRLYCLHVSEQIVILGNGGKKTSQKVKDSPDAFPHFELMNHFATIFHHKKRSGKIIVDGSVLKGDLTFYIK